MLSLTVIAIVLLQNICWGGEGRRRYKLRACARCTKTLLLMVPQSDHGFGWQSWQPKSLNHYVRSLWSLKTNWVVFHRSTYLTISLRAHLADLSFPKVSQSKENKAVAPIQTLNRCSKYKKNSSLNWQNKMVYYWILFMINWQTKFKN